MNTPNPARRSSTITLLMALVLSGAATAEARPTAELGTAPVAAARAGDSTVIGNIAPRRLNGQPQMGDLGELTNIPTVMGAQMCDPADETAPGPIAGRSWTYYNPRDDTSGLSTDLTITRWRNAAHELAAIPVDEGVCSLLPGWRQQAWPGTDRRTHLLLVNRSRRDAAAVIRVDDVLVAAEVWDWDGTGDEVAAAIRSAERSARRVR